MFLNSHDKGVISEFIALVILKIKGYQALKKRYKTSLGEIDLICKKKDYIIFIEIKFRKDKHSLFDSINKKQQHRIISASKVYLQQNNLYHSNIRYDAIFISKPFFFKHIKNAFF